MPETNQAKVNSASIASGAGVGANVLRPVSIRLLYDGMIVEDDIYDSSKDRLIVSAGSTMTADLIDRVHRINNGSDTIYVTGRTLKTMSTKKPNIDMDKLEDVENTTGYANALTAIDNLYENIAVLNKVIIDGFLPVSAQLAELIKSKPPAVLLSLINGISEEVRYLPRHIVNVALLNGMTASWLGMPEDQIETMVLVGLLHDCGHAFTPAPILQGAHKITKLEHEVVKMHTIRNGELLTDYPDAVRIPAVSHHERLSGCGYPAGLSGNAIDKITRITAISDIYEAVVSARAFRKPRSPFCALALLTKLAEADVDSSIAGTLCKNIPPHLVDKPVTLSDGTIGIVREFDPKNIEFPKVELTGRMLLTNEKLHCVSMYSD